MRVLWASLATVLGGICIGLLLFGLKKPLTEWWWGWTTQSKQKHVPQYPVCSTNILWKTDHIKINDTTTISLCYPTTWTRKDTLFTNKDGQKVADITPTKNPDITQEIMTLGDTTAIRQIKDDRYIFILTEPPLALTFYTSTQNNDLDQTFTQIAASIKHLR